MDFYALNTMKQQQPDYCVLRSYPEGMGLASCHFTIGTPVEPGEYPQDARIRMSDEESGTVVPDLVGNTGGMLLLSWRLAEQVNRVQRAPTQYLPLTILDHQGRVAADRHFIVHPVGVHDALDLEASDIKWFKGQVVKIRRYVIAPSRLRDAPDLFRLKHEPATYVASERLLDAWRALKPVSNVSITRIDQSTRRRAKAPSTT